MNDNLNLASLAQAQSCLDELRHVFEGTHACLAEDSLGTVRFDLLHDLFCFFLATRGDIVDHHICAALSQQDSNASANATNQSSLSVSFIGKEGDLGDFHQQKSPASCTRSHREAPVTIATFPDRSSPLKSGMMNYMINAK